MFKEEEHRPKYSLDPSIIHEMLSSGCSHDRKDGRPFSCFSFFSVLDVITIRENFCYRKNKLGKLVSLNESEIYEKLLSFLKSHQVKKEDRIHGAHKIRDGYFMLHLESKHKVSLCLKAFSAILGIKAN